VTRCRIFPLDEAKDKRWRQHCLSELSKRWHIPPEQIVDALLLEAYLQMITERTQPDIRLTEAGSSRAAKTWIADIPPREMS
jgi:hypothetical protein